MATRTVYAMVRQCGCCDDRSERYFTVDCPEHGLMEADEQAGGYRCAADGCGRRISDDEVYQREKAASDAAAGSRPRVLSIVVT